ncbi:MAG: nucleotidyl transferase AbiEii/AbiGii toxin family protein [bacterium]|nr:nucleotidyl transferase AbiEii/AbiGii toxin family protein [bacterium]
MARELKNVAASVRARLQNLAREQQANFQRVLTRYALERFLFRLSVSPHKELFVLKGAMLYAAWLEDPFRTTRDLDLLSLADREMASLLETIRDVCAQPVADDGLRFDIENIFAAPFDEERTHGTFRVRTSAQLGTAIVPVQIDIGFGDTVTPGPLELEYPVLLDHPTPTLYAYPRETVAAEKFEAIVALDLANC